MHLRLRLVGVFLAVGALAVIAPTRPAFTVATGTGLALLMVVADILRAPRPAELRPAREVAAVLRMDRPADVVVSLHNPTRRTLAVDVHDATPPSMRRRPLRHHVTIEPGA